MNQREHIVTNTETELHPQLRIDDSIRGLQLSIEGLLKLLGGTPEERERFWEIVKGITSVADNLLVASSVQAARLQVDAVRAIANSVQQAAHEIRG